MPTTRRHLLLGTGLAATAFPARAQTDSIVLGALFPFSGDVALLGDESFRGLDLATDERNANGGLFGKRIRLARGDAADTTQAAGEARRLMDTEHVAAIFGTYGSGLSIAASQATEVAGVPYFELGAIADSITERGFKYLFRSCAISSDFASLSVETVTTILPRIWKLDASTLKVAALHEDGVAGTGIGNVQEKRSHEEGLNLVVRLSYSTSTIDFASAVQRLKGAGVDVVLHTGAFNDIVSFYRAMKQAGWKPRMVIGSGAGYSLNDTMQAVGGDFAGTMSVDFPQYKLNDAFAPGVATVAVSYQRKYGAPPRSGHSLANYVGAKLFYDAIARAGSTDKDKVRAAVLATSIPAGGMASGWGAVFDDKGQNLRALPLLAQWQGGALVTVFPTTAAVAQPIGSLGG